MSWLFSRKAPVTNGNTGGVITLASLRKNNTVFLLSDVPYVSTSDYSLQVFRFRFRIYSVFTYVLHKGRFSEHNLQALFLHLNTFLLQRIMNAMLQKHTIM